ncbi:hypothetical protein ACLB2K_033569 [Fragaria x ananassa]
MVSLLSRIGMFIQCGSLRTWLVQFLLWGLTEWTFICEQVIKVEAPTPCIAMSKRQKLDEGNTSNQARKAGKDLKKDNAVAGSAQGSKPEIELMWAKMTSVQQQVSQLTNRVGKIEPTMENVVEVVEGIKGTLQSSLNEANLAKIMKDMNMLDAILGEDIVNLLDGICSFASLPWYYTTPIRQPNTADCGVFVLRNMEDPTSKWAQKYDSHSERLRLLLDCLRHEKNEISDIHSKVQQSLLSWKGGKKQPKQVSKANDSKAAPFVVNLISGDT